MPNRDGTGPAGRGPGTGRGRGPCKTTPQKRKTSRPTRRKKGRK